METFLLVPKLVQCYVKDHIGKSNLENFIKKKLVNPSRKAKKVGGGELLEQKSILEKVIWAY